MKTCGKCKKIGEFYKDKQKSDGLTSYCKECINATSVQYGNANPHIRRAASSKWSKSNRHKVNAYKMALVAEDKNGAPQSIYKLHKNEIEAVYSLARELQWLAEEKLEVDHIIPLKHDLVCGLHVPWNLQILPISTNRSKWNNLEGVSF